MFLDGVGFDLTDTPKGNGVVPNQELGDDDVETLQELGGGSVLFESLLRGGYGIAICMEHILNI